MHLDDIVSGRSAFRVVIDGIATMASQLIEVLRGHPVSTVDLGLATATAGRGRRQPRAQRRTSRSPSTARPTRQRRSSKPGRSTVPTDIATQSLPSRSVKNGGSSPTAKMVAYAKSLAGNKNIKLPPGYDQDFETCRRFLDQHSR
jgi:DNA topoisomerase-3